VYFIQLLLLRKVAWGCRVMVMPTMMIRCVNNQGQEPDTPDFASQTAKINSRQNQGCYRALMESQLRHLWVIDLPFTAQITWKFSSCSIMNKKERTMVVT
jgi:hypothetical protein